VMLPQIVLSSCLAKPALGWMQPKAPREHDRERKPQADG
jgi:hypothetical protein